MIDSYKHQGLRKQLIQELRNKGIQNEDVLNAMYQVPRHYFMDNAFLQFAYDDKAFPIGAGQTISQPYTVAFQTNLLDFKKGMKILEIGTGSGYQTAVLCEMGAKVFSIERQKTLHIKTKDLLEKLGYNTAKLFYGDGYKGQEAYAPFDRVLVTAGAPFIPEALKKQLKVGGKLIIPITKKNEVQTMTELIKVNDHEFTSIEHGEFKFVPLLENRT